MKTRIISILMVAFLFLMGGFTHVAGALPMETSANRSTTIEMSGKLFPPTPIEYDEYGYHIALSGDVLVVAGYNEKVHIYQQDEGGVNNWGHVKTLTPGGTDYWGNIEVDIDGDILVTGLPGDNSGTGAGSAKVYYRNEGGTDNWGFMANMTPTDGSSGDFFGDSVSISGSTIVIGAPNEGDTLEGAVYVYNQNEGGSDNWGELMKITSAIRIEWAGFGTQVVLSGDILTVSAPWEDGSSLQEVGAVYVYDRNQGGSNAWGNVAQIQGDVEYGRYGARLALDGDTFIAGAPSFGEYPGYPGYEIGHAHVHQQNYGGTDNWGKVAELTPSDISTNELNSYNSLEIFGDEILVGASYHEVNGLNAGAVYRFGRNEGGTDNWGEIEKLIPANPTGEIGFGISTAFNVQTTAIGAPYDSSVGASVGAVFINKTNSGEADLSLVKSGSPNPVSLGGTVTYTISVDNAGPDTAENVTVTDHLPDGVSLQEASGPGWDCNGWDAVVNCTRVSLNTGPASDITIEVSAPSTEGDITNLAYVSSSTGDPDLTNNDNETSPTVVTVTSIADLSMTKTAHENPVAPGETIIYYVDVTNNGPQPASDVVMIDNLPPEAVMDFATTSENWWWNCNIVDHTVTCNRSEQMASGETETIIIYVNAPDEPGVIYNTATVATSTHDSNLNNNDNIYDPHVLTVGGGADLSLTKAGTPDTVSAGGLITYTISVSNAGPDEATNVIVTDPLPSGVTFQTVNGTGWSCSVSDGTLTCTRASLAVGDAPDIDVEVLAPSSAGTLSNVAYVTSQTGDPDETNNDNSPNPVETTVLATADLGITKEASPLSVLPGENLTYTLTVTNNGPETAEDVTVTDDLADNLTFQSASGTGWTCDESGTEVTCTMAAMPVGSSSIVIEVLAPPTGFATVDNSAAVSATTNDNNSGNNNAGPVTVTEDVNEVDLSLTMTPPSQEIEQGGTVGLTLSVTNAGPDPAADVSLVVSIPAELTYMSASGIGWSCTYAAPDLTCERSDLAVGAAPDINLSLQGDQLGTYNGTGTVSSSDIEGIPSDNTDTFTIDVLEFIGYQIYIPMVTN
jgi:uncharacterized repeat protein (TIGR01451 family)